MIHLAFIYLVSLRIVNYFCINLTFKLAHFWAVMPDCDALADGSGREEDSLDLSLSQIAHFCVDILSASVPRIKKSHVLKMVQELSMERRTIHIPKKCHIGDVVAVMALVC